MGADNFYTTAFGKTAHDAFITAINDARYENGHGGYTGTIAEKSSFIQVQVPKGKRVKNFLDEQIKSERFDDKWGPAGCVDITTLQKKVYKERKQTWPRGKKYFAFFGYASS